MTAVDFERRHEVVHYQDQTSANVQVSVGNSPDTNCDCFMQDFNSRGIQNCVTNPDS